VFVEDRVECGTARYCSLTDLRPTFASPFSLSTPFLSNIRAYARQGRERLLLTLRPGQDVLVAHTNATHVRATVLEVDCSVALLLLPEVKKMEWVYRGSTRFKAILDEYERRKSELKASCEDEAVDKPISRRYRDCAIDNKMIFTAI
jgi:hypothetical protein